MWNNRLYDNLHLVLLAPDRISQDTDHAERINLLIEKLGISSRVTYLSTWNANLAKYMYSCSRTLITFLPVRESPEDLIPMECRVNPKNSILLTSNIGSNRFQVEDGVDGFLFNLDCDQLDDINYIQAADKDSLSLKNLSLIDLMERILNLSDIERKKIVEAGKNKIANRYDAIINFRYNFTHDGNNVE